MILIIALYLKTISNNNKITMKRILILAILISGVLLSCNNKNRENTDADENADKVSEKVICLELTYPISFIMPDATEISGNDRTEIGTAMRAWHDANPSSKERGVMKYPVNAMFKGNSVAIGSEEEMQRMKAECQGEKKEPCFTFIYPITYIMPDATTFTINSEDDRINKAAIRAWYGDNPGVEDRPTLLYPLNVKLKDESISTLENDEEMMLLRKDCN